MEEENIKRNIHRLIVYECLGHTFSTAAIICLLGIITSTIIPGAYYQEWQSTEYLKVVPWTVIGPVTFSLIFFILTFVSIYIFNHSRYWDNIPPERKKQVNRRNYIYLSGFEKIITKFPIIISFIILLVFASLGIYAVKLDKENIIEERYQIITNILNEYHTLNPKIENEYSYDKINKTYQNEFVTIILKDNMKYDLEFDKNKIREVSYVVSSDITEENINSKLNEVIEKTKELKDKASILDNYLEEKIAKKLKIVFTEEGIKELTDKTKEMLLEEYEYEYKYIDIYQELEDTAYRQRTYIKKKDKQMIFETSIIENGTYLLN